MNRIELKQRGKAAFKANYWKSVLVAFLLAIAVGGFNAGNASYNVDTDEVEDLFDPSTSYSQEVISGDTLSEQLNEQGIDADFSSLLGEQATVTAEEDSVPIVKDVGTVAGLGSLGMLLTIFLFGPLEISCRNFFKKNLSAPAELEELNVGFVPKYWHNLATMLLKTIFQFLWFLLLIIPGVVMSYAYAMTPYLAADHPELGAKATIDLSRDMMKGHKWELFVLDLSFLGWILLSIITFGIVEIFYTGPYMASTHAAFYKELSGQTTAPTDVVEADIPAEA